MLSKKLLITIFSVIVIFTSSTVLAAPYQFGGEINVGTNSLFFKENSTNNIYEIINLNLDFDNANFEIDASNNLTGQGNFDISLKKAYVRHKFNDMRVTVGKQPVSWSFGSLINPVDYSLGAEALDEESSAKYVNAIELHYPVNWYSSLSLVSEINANYDKYGFRARTLIKDFDVSLNYVNQTGISDIRRWGLSLKGDIKNAGVYGSYTNLDYVYQSGPKVTTEALMLGSDYSYFLNQGYGNRLYMQGEYHVIEKNEGLMVFLESLAGAGLGINPERFFGGDEYFDAFLTNINYSINDFSSIGIFTLTSLEDGSTAIIPNYTNQLSTNTTLNINISYLSGNESKDFSGGENLPTAVLNIELSYVF